MPRIAIVLLLAPLLWGAACAPTARSPDGQGIRSKPSTEPNGDLADRENARATDHLRARRYDQAEAASKAALAADANNGRAHNNLGTAYFHQGKYYLAAWEYQHAAKLMSQHPEPRNNLGMVFEKAGKLDDAVEWYGRAAAMEPDNPEFAGNLARARVRRGDDGNEVRALLAKIISADLRPEWVGWAKQRLALLRPPTTQGVGGTAEGD